MDITKKAALVGCSDPLPAREKEDIRRLPGILEAMGVSLEISPLLLRDEPPAPREKAEALNRHFRAPDVDFVFDVSGGDLANTTLPYIDFDAARASRALLFGFSDLSTVLNAVVAKTGRPAVNYQIRNLLYADSEAQRVFFKEKILTDALSPADLAPRFLRGKEMHGKIYGGNIRCFLKLAGTAYWPELDGGILLLESLGGGVNQMVTALEQLKQLGVLDRINGILLGTFTNMEEKKLSPSIEELVLETAPASVAVAKTNLVGHYPDARAVMLGVNTRIG